VQLSELREAAETAEEAITAHTQQMDKLSEQLRGRCEEVARLEASIEAMKKDLEAKDKRIQHLDRSKLTVEQVERIQKLKKDHQHALDEVTYDGHVPARAM
jgi:septal ring factor EnvC (AmiA/AmiB activator)